MHTHTTCIPFRALEKPVGLVQASGKHDSSAHPALMAMDSYARFERLAAEQSSEDEDEENAQPNMADPFMDRACSEESLLRAFVAVHEKRMQVDAKHAQVGPSTEGTCPALRRPLLIDIAREYDDLCERILALDGVNAEQALRSCGHRIEASHCRLAAAQALHIAGCLEEAVERCGRALAAAKGHGYQEAAKGMQDLEQKLRRTAMESLRRRAQLLLRLGKHGSTEAKESQGSPGTLTFPVRPRGPKALECLVSQGSPGSQGSQGLEPTPTVPYCPSEVVTTPRLQTQGCPIFCKYTPSKNRGDIAFSIFLAD